MPVVDIKAKSRLRAAFFCLFDGCSVGMWFWIFVICTGGWMDCRMG
jgi:hypothetical protein